MIVSMLTAAIYAASRRQPRGSLGRHWLAQVPAPRSSGSRGDCLAASSDVVGGVQTAKRAQYAGWRAAASEQGKAFAELLARLRPTVHSRSTRTASSRAPRECLGNLRGPSTVQLSWTRWHAVATFEPVWRGAVPTTERVAEQRQRLQHPALARPRCDLWGAATGLAVLARLDLLSTRQRLLSA